MSVGTEKLFANVQTGGEQEEEEDYGKCKNAVKIKWTEEREDFPSRRFVVKMLDAWRNVKKSCPNIEEQLKDILVETIPEKQVQVSKQAETTAQSNVIPTPSEQQKGEKWKAGVRRENRKRRKVRRETRARKVGKKINRKNDSQNRFEEEVKKAEELERMEKEEEREKKKKSSTGHEKKRKKDQAEVSLEVE
ncbi:hypothetical protein XELAEV_18041559mg [Xenopus laevis]|uniref:Uncharacterized protein n=1 Tax=Xenopus laevis TaxID=8355 RepID=A0A974C2F8_XENLA|nr:hypothetical protein XELAEV_18041559mg [Xenopus laevis]